MWLGVAQITHGSHNLFHDFPENDLYTVYNFPYPTAVANLYCFDNIKNERSLQMKTTIVFKKT